MKKVLSIALILALVICAFAGCSNPKKDILGTWIGSKDLLLVDAEYSFTFNEDGTGKMAAPELNNLTGMELGVDMTYVIEDDQITITTSALFLSKTTTYTMAFDGDTLTLTSGNDVITLTKQA